MIGTRSLLLVAIFALAAVQAEAGWKPVWHKKHRSPCGKKPHSCHTGKLVCVKFVKIVKKKWFHKKTISYRWTCYKKKPHYHPKPTYWPKPHPSHPPHTEPPVYIPPPPTPAPTPAPTNAQCPPKPWCAWEGYGENGFDVPYCRRIIEHDDQCHWWCPPPPCTWPHPKPKPCENARCVDNKWWCPRPKTPPPTAAPTPPPTPAPTPPPTPKCQPPKCDWAGYDKTPGFKFPECKLVNADKCKWWCPPKPCGWPVLKPKPCKCEHNKWWCPADHPAPTAPPTPKA